MSGKPQSWKTIRDQRRKENFVGRGEQLRTFEENFAAEMPSYMVFAVTGEGGVGKSTLLAQYAGIARSPNINVSVIICDDRHPSPTVAMGHVANELAKRDIRHKEFDERYKKYREIREEIEKDPKAPRGIVNLLALGVTDFTIKNLRKVPGAGVFFEHTDSKAAGEALVELMNYGITRWGNKDEVQLLREPERILTPLFIELLTQACDQQRLILMFDVFERTSDTVSPWLLALFNFEYGEFDTRLTFVISGRDPLEQHWTELAGSICHVPLEPFTMNETRLYLSNRGITDERLVAKIHEDTGGLPVLVELLAATNPQPNVTLPDISKDAVARFLQWTPQEEHRRVALLAAVPRQFNRDILSAALGKDATATFNWLAGQSYIRTNSERGWFYHEKVRELMLRYLRNTTPSDLTETHTRLAEYFATAQTQLGLKNKAAYDSEKWRGLECERIYHAVCAQPDRNIEVAMNAFLLAFRWRWRFSESIAKTCQQAGYESNSQSLRECAKLLTELYEAHNKDNYAIVIQKLEFLETQSNLTQIARCEIYALRAETHRSMGQYEQALADFDRAIALDEKYAWAIASRGQTYLQMNKYEQALTDLDRAIAIDEKSNWMIAQRGVNFRLMGKYEQALTDFDRAIMLDEKFAQAIAHRGEAYRLMGKYEQALADFDRAIILNEKYAWAFASRGETYRKMGKYEQALADFDRVIVLDEKYTRAIAKRGQTHRQMGKYEQALADYDRAIELDEKSAWKIAGRGETYRLIGKYEQALADFDHAITLDEKYAWAIASRGQTYRQMGKYEQALADFDRAIALDEKSAWIFAERGETYRLMGKYQQVLADFNRAIALDEKYTWAIASRGQTYRQIGKYEQALADLDYAIALDEKSAWKFTERGRIYRQMGKYEQALTDFDRAIALDEKSAWKIAGRGETYRRMGRYEQALSDFDRAIGLDEKNYFALTRRTATHIKIGNSEAAQHDLQRVLTLPLENASDFYRRALALILSNKHSEAIEMLRQAFQRDTAERVYAQTDDLLDPIRNLPDFQELMNAA